MLSVLYGPHDGESYVHIASKAEAAFYNGWSRTAWSLALGYIILACSLGRGGKKGCVTFGNNNSDYRYPTTISQ